MVSERLLSAVLSDFARTMVSDFPIQSILDRLVERIVEVLPVTAAGVSLMAPGHSPHFVAASSPPALQLEKLQAALEAGPCVTAWSSGAPVCVPDLHADDTYPEFQAAAASTGLVAVFAFPLRHNEERLGALDLFRDSPGPLDERDLEAAQTLADVAAAYLLNAQAREQAQVVADQFRHGALHDGLTGLPNRVLLEQRLEHAAERARRTHTHAAVLFADLDGFKRVNDTYGHAVGDALLVAVARRLTGLIRPGDTLARVSGDEFVVLCEDLTAAADAEVLAQRIDTAFRTPFTLPGPAPGAAPGTALGAAAGAGGAREADDAQPTAGLQLRVTASVGMAYAGRAEDIGHRLVRDADTAMYRAKRSGGGVSRLLDLRDAPAGARRSELGRDLREAFADRRLSVVYQPIVRAADGTVTGAEALLRWLDPVRGPVEPLLMISIAEQSSLILDLGSWVLQTACADLRRLPPGRHGRPLDLAVNVSARQLLEPGYSSAVAAALDRTGIDPGQLVLEITEGIGLDDTARTVTVLSELRALGVRLALDDFGTGYSSLSYLRRYPVDIIKIDQGFVADIGHEPGGSAIIGAITHLAHVLGMTVTAEGVENARQHDEIVSLGCEAAQGYYYGRPQSADSLRDDLRRRGADAALGGAR